jgi:EAL domain-containing protein (putative c-di-GMP-specific phosphodiesterase class I)
VKIDRAFVAGLGQDRGDEAIVEAVVGLGRSLGLTTVAEGVETEGQMARLRELGCDRVQGYLFCRPQPPAELEGLFTGLRRPSEQGPLVDLAAMTPEREPSA